MAGPGAPLCSAPGSNSGWFIQAERRGHPLLPALPPMPAGFVHKTGTIDFLSRVGPRGFFHPHSLHLPYDPELLQIIGWRADCGDENGVFPLALTDPEADSPRDLVLILH